ncbi:MAG: trehalose-6-phosphate synthase [Dehalococcoidia bacterium]
MQQSGLILANRAYLDHESPRWADSPSSSGKGGLLAALRPVIEPWDGERGTTWIGAGLGRYDREWTDDRGFELIDTPRGPLRHRRLYFGESTWHGHYAEVANSFLWPLYHLVRHDLPKLTGYYPIPAAPAKNDWEAYTRVNRAFASAAAEESRADWAWVHDYQLSLVPAMLRGSGFTGRIGYFLHTPFPDVTVAAPYLTGSASGAIRAVIEGMLGSDLIGFQTSADVERFQRAATTLCGGAVTDGGLSYDGRSIDTRAFPVGIDPDDVYEVAKRVPVPARVRSARESGLPLVVGLERGDFTKGIPERMAAMTRAFERGAKFAYLGIAAPTREGVRAYESLEAAIEVTASEAREAARAAGGTLTHVRANVGWDDVVALQREADVVFTSSLADGQNLVPLQAAIAQSVRPADERAVIITGQDAGAASTFAEFSEEGLVAVDPLDAEAMVAVLCDALAGRPGRVSDRFVEEVRRRDALSWATGFLESLEERC